MPSSGTLSARGRVASLSRSRSSDDPDYLNAKRDLASEKIAAYIERTVAEAPPLTTEQRSRLAALLTGATGPRESRRPASVDRDLAASPDHIALAEATAGGDTQ